MFSVSLAIIVIGLALIRALAEVTMELKKVVPGNFGPSGSCFYENFEFFAIITLLYYYFSIRDNDIFCSN